MRRAEKHSSTMSWRKELGATETIYEEEEKSSSSSLLSSSHSSSLLSSLHTRVDDWSRARGSKPNVVVRVHDHRFYLHKVPLLAHSGYFRRHVDAETTVVVVSPPSTITVETFTFVAGFCYGLEVSMTPFNVAAVRIAAEWLEMTNNEWDECGVAVVEEGEGNLMERAEWYFCQTLASSAEYATEVLRSCISLLPDAAESAAFLAGRCVEALIVSNGVDKTKSHWLDDVVMVNTEDFQMIADSIHDRLPDCHDLLYRIIDHYLENCPVTALPSEEAKNRICSVVDCKKLSRTHLVHLVRNRRMPLRFVVQAMFIEQFDTRVSFLDRIRKNRGEEEEVITAASHTVKTGGSMTLGDMLQQDAASRQATNLKASMEETSFRIRSLEAEISCMRKTLRKLKMEEETEAESAMRSESCRFWAEEEKLNRKEAEKIDRGSGKLYLKMIRGFKSVLFRRTGSDSRSSACSGAYSDVRPTHQRNRSVSLVHDI